MNPYRRMRRLAPLQDLEHIAKDIVDQTETKACLKAGLGIGFHWFRLVSFTRAIFPKRTPMEPNFPGSARTEPRPKSQFPLLPFAETNMFCHCPWLVLKGGKMDHPKYEQLFFHGVCLKRKRGKLLVSLSRG